VNLDELGTVYGTLLNFRGEVQAWAPKMNEAPYKAPPRQPVLYIKTANTWSNDGTTIPVPARAPQVEVGATIAMVMKAPNQVGGYRLMNDLSLPHASFFRPPVKFKCLDGFLGIGDTLVPAGSDVDPSTFVVEVRINGELKQTVRFDGLVRDAQQLLADVSAFMTLGEGDALMLGCDAGRPLAKVGDRIEISAPGFGTLTNTLVAESSGDGPPLAASGPLGGQRGHEVPSVGAKSS
jgi:5-oxopent-3-ene-1,2,5-tricarboxylate decarboxylase/2-hydroxyhepta-2,4-diene-1,7-dioate isomerase